MSDRAAQASRPVSAGASSWKSFTGFRLLFSVLVPLVAVVVLYRVDSFEPAEFPLHELGPTQLAAPLRNAKILRGAEFVGAGRLQAPEDILYEPESGVLYTGCEDGWVKRVTVNDSAVDTVVEDWVYTGGRPLGFAFGRDGEVIVADAYKGLLNISRAGTAGELLADEADGVKFKLTDDVDVAADGVMYFTDATYKYPLEEFLMDFLEGKPHGRLLSYDPATKQAKVLLGKLYFANGVVVSPDQSSVIYCETAMRRCSRYYIAGEKSGRVEKFVENLPGMPDNIRYDGHGSYWIAMVTSITTPWSLALKYPLLRKILGILFKFNLRPSMEMDGGALQVDLEGKPISHYYDPGLSLISTAVRIGNYLYFGSVRYPHIIRLDLNHHPARSEA